MRKLNKVKMMKTKISHNQKEKMKIEKKDRWR